MEEAPLNAGNAVIVIATKSHLEGQAQRLQERGHDLAAALEQGGYLR